MGRLNTSKILCRAFHYGQTDRGGTEYYKHPYTVAKLCKHRNAKMVAYMHDLIEDTTCTIELIKNLGYSKKIIDALTAITHDKAMKYSEYLKLVKHNKIATEVKIADMIHNADISRIPNPTEEDCNRSLRYLKYIDYLQNRCSYEEIKQI